MTEQPGSWPEYPSVDAWLPVSAVDGFADELAAALAEDVSHAWFQTPDTAATDPRSGEDIRVAWLADGGLHLATVQAVATHHGAMLVLTRRHVNLNDLFHKHDESAT